MTGAIHQSTYGLCVGLPTLVSVGQLVDEGRTGADGVPVLVVPPHLPTGLLHCDRPLHGVADGRRPASRPAGATIKRLVELSQELLVNVGRHRGLRHGGYGTPEAVSPPEVAA